MLFDTHCHVQMQPFQNDADEVIKKTLEKSVFMNVVGTQYKTSKQAVELVQRYEGMYASVGLHPTHLFPEYFGGEEVIDKTNETDFDYESYKKLAQHGKVIAIGECGLDTYRLPEGVNKQTIVNRQQEIFLQHVALAEECSLPLIIHVRDAHLEMIEVLKQAQQTYNQQLRGVIHCYDNTWENAQEFLRLGFYLGFTGIITFPPKKSNPEAQEKLLEVIKNCPLDKILLETDAPFLAPLPHRGKRAEPWMVEEVAKKVAEIKSISFEEVGKQTIQNSQKLFSF